MIMKIKKRLMDLILIIDMVQFNIMIFGVELYMSQKSFVMKFIDQEEEGCSEGDVIYVHLSLTFQI